MSRTTDDVPRQYVPNTRIIPINTVANLAGTCANGEFSICTFEVPATFARFATVSYGHLRRNALTPHENTKVLRRKCPYDTYQNGGEPGERSGNFECANGE